MLKIYKYKISINHKTIKNYFRLGIPKNSQILSVQIKNNAPHLFVLSDVKFDYSERYFKLVKENSLIDKDFKDLNYIGSFEDCFEGRIFIFYLFEVFIGVTLSKFEKGDKYYEEKSHKI